MSHGGNTGGAGTGNAPNSVFFSGSEHSSGGNSMTVSGVTNRGRTQEV